MKWPERLKSGTQMFIDAKATLWRSGMGLASGRGETRVETWVEMCRLELRRGLSWRKASVTECNWQEAGRFGRK